MLKLFSLVYFEDKQVVVSGHLEPEALQETLPEVNELVEFLKDISSDATVIISIALLEYMDGIGNSTTKINASELDLRILQSKLPELYDKHQITECDAFEIQPRGLRDDKQEEFVDTVDYTE